MSFSIYPVSSLADKDTLIIIEADLHTDFSYLEEEGFILSRIKEYKTNKHVFCAQKKVRIPHGNSSISRKF